MRVLIDVNLTREWVAFFARYEIDAVHWSSVGDEASKDPPILAYAKSEARILLTADLDFNAILASTRDSAPSVVTMRTSSRLPSEVGDRLVRAMIQVEQSLLDGAILLVDDSKVRLRTLPF
jgi:predicted nuclease of predicted toxin-antitoxin system